MLSLSPSYFCIPCKKPQSRYLYHADIWKKIDNSLGDDCIRFNLFLIIDSLKNTLAKSNTPFKRCY